VCERGREREKERERKRIKRMKRERERALYCGKVASLIWIQFAADAL